MTEQPDHLVDPGLAAYGTEAEKGYLKAVNEFGGYRAAAKALGVPNHSVISRAIGRLERRAALQGYAPDNGLTHPVAPGFTLKRKSTYYRATDDTPAGWVIQEPGKGVAFAAIRDWIEGLTADVFTPPPFTPAPTMTDTDLLCVIPMGDPHFGMYAWKDESGDDFDLKIAERITLAAVDNLISRAPPAETGILLNLGDMFHADGNDGGTTKGTPQDVDGRWQKVMQVGLRTMIHCVSRMKQKFRYVVVRVDPGNHDKESAFALAMALDCMFHDDERVTVDLSPAEHWYYKFGKSMIGSTHGDGAKMDALPGIMAFDQRRHLADVDYCYWYCGHIHTEKVQEYAGCIVKYFRTLAPGNAWSTGAGYRAGRDMRCIVLHREFGEWDTMISPIRLIDQVAA